MCLSGNRPPALPFFAPALLAPPSTCFGARAPARTPPLVESEAFFPPSDFFAPSFFCTASGSRPLPSEALSARFSCGRRERSSAAEPESALSPRARARAGARSPASRRTGPRRTTARAARDCGASSFLNLESWAAMADLSSLVGRRGCTGVPAAQRAGVVRCGGARRRARVARP